MQDSPHKSTWSQTKFPKQIEVFGRKTGWEYRKDTSEVELYSKVILRQDLIVEKPEITNSRIANITLVILHGLLANGNHFQSIAESLMIKNEMITEVILIDLRNHGASDHHDSMTYSEMSEDLFRHLNSLNISSFILMGHSMGAKTAMIFSMTHGNMVNGLVLLDTYPKDYKNYPEVYFHSLDLVNKLSDIDLKEYNHSEFLDYLKSEFVYYYLTLQGPNLMNQVDQNILKNEDGSLQWKINLSSIKNNFSNLIGFEYLSNQNKSLYEGPIMVLLGEKSLSFGFDEFKMIFTYFSEQKNVKIIPNASKYIILNTIIGHWIHLDSPYELVNTVSDFIVQLMARQD